MFALIQKPLVFGVQYADVCSKKNVYLGPKAVTELRD